jgi:hypothetical protein
MASPESISTLIAQLQELPVSQSPGWGSPAPGWWWLIALVLLLLLLRTLLYLRSYWADRYRRRALLAVREIESQLDLGRHSPEMGAELASLLRHTASAAAGHPVNLVGADWCDYLDHRLAQPCFDGRFGELLCEAPYRRVSHTELKALAGAVRHWLEFHRAAV